MPVAQARNVSAIRRPSPLIEGDIGTPVDAARAGWAATRRFAGHWGEQEC
jgi:hypothetical protein